MLIPHLSRKWGVYDILQTNPQNNNYKKISFGTNEPVKIMNFPDDFENIGTGKFDWSHKKGSEVLFCFDLSKPIKQLILKAEKLLKEKQKYFKNKQKEYRNQYHSYPNYLRLLDAERADVTTPEMAETIFPNYTNAYPDYNAKQHVKDGLKAAKLLRDHNYLFLTTGK